MNAKASDDFLDRLFESFFKKLSIPNLMQRTGYHVLARYVPKDQIDPEVSQVLDSMVETERRATPVRGEEQPP